MIDLTPLDVRNKRGDFKKQLRGYDPEEVDVFLQLVAERLDQLVMENLKLRERSENLQQQVQSQTGRERAVQEALVTAQELRSDIREQAERQAELILAEARTEARRLTAEAEAETKAAVRAAERRLQDGRDALEEVEHRRHRFLKQFRQLLERELDVVEVEEGRAPLEERAIDLDLGGGRRRSGDEAAREARAALEAQLAGDLEEALDVSNLAPDDPADDDDVAVTARPDPDDDDDETLSLSLDDAAPADDDDSRWG
ncbi:MAG: DivIVA domain-containing protein [Longimicrobiales bacterium]